MLVLQLFVLGVTSISSFFSNCRFCKDNFDRDYKATIGVDFEIERFEIIGVPYNLQM